MSAASVGVIIKGEGVILSTVIVVEPPPPPPPPEPAAKRVSLPSIFSPFLSFSQTSTISASPTVTVADSSPIAPLSGSSVPSPMGSPSASTRTISSLPSSVSRTSMSLGTPPSISVCIAVIRSSRLSYSPFASAT